MANVIPLPEPDNDGYTTFEELTADNFLDLTIQTDYRRLGRFKLKVPTVIEWLDDKLLVAEPPIPLGTLVNGATRQPDPWNPDYRAKLERAFEERKLIHVARALDEGGKMPLQGRTILDKAETLERAKLPLFNLLWSRLDAAMEKGLAWTDPTGELFRGLQATETRHASQIQALVEGLERDAGSEPGMAAGDAAGDESVSAVDVSAD